MHKEEIRLLREKARDYGIELSEQQLDLFQTYLDELWAWNRRINLTGLARRERMVFELFLDSLIPSPHIAERGRLLDAGSGAGFPGLPLKICKPYLQTHLLEANSKKANFLKQVIRLLRLKETKVITGRIEKDGERLHPDGYQLITARALAPLNKTIGWCAPHLSPEGILISFLGGRAESELKENRHVMEAHCLTIWKKIPYTLPGKRSERMTIIFKKEASYGETFGK